MATLASRRQVSGLKEILRILTLTEILQNLANVPEMFKRFFSGASSFNFGQKDSLVQIRIWVTHKEHIYNDFK